MQFEIHMASELIFGGGSRFRTGELALKAGLKKALVITDSFLVDKPVFKEVVESLAKAGVSAEIFCDISAEPTDTIVYNAANKLQTSGCDGIVAVGGGSCIDTAKAVSVFATNGGKISDFQGYGKVKKQGLTLIVLPTTAGTGSEVTRVTIIQDLDRNVKMMCLDNAFMPNIALVDYEMTMSMPPALTSFVGIDALTHAIEALVSRKANPITDLYAEAAISLISNSLMTVYNTPSDQDAREKMMRASTYAGIAFSNASVCAVHGMSRPIGAYFHVPHGLSNAFLLPVVMANSIPGNFAIYARVAKAMGVASENDSNELAANKGLARVNELNALLHIPNMKDYGIPEDKYLNNLQKMAQDALDSGSPNNNPRLFTRDELVEIYKEAYYYH